MSNEQKLLAALKHVEGFFAELAKRSKDYPGSLYTHNFIKQIIREITNNTKEDL